MNIELEVKSFPKPEANKKQKIEMPKIDVECPSCKQRHWIEFDKGQQGWNCDIIIKKQKHQVDTKAIRENECFSSRLQSANKKIKKICFSLVKIKYKTTKDLIWLKN